MRARHSIAVAAAALAAAAALTGCGGDKPDASAPLLKPIATGAADNGPFRDLTARQVLDRSEMAMKDVPSMTADVTGLFEGEAMRARVVVTRTGMCAAAFRLDGDAVQLIGTGGKNLYMKADAGFWKAKGGPRGGAVAATLAGKWVKLPAKAVDSGDLSGFCTTSGLLDGLTDGDGALVKGHPTTVAGQPVLPIIQTASDETTTFYVAATGLPYLVKVSTPDGSDPATGTFTDFGKPAHINRPPASETLDLSVLTGPDGDGFSI